MARCIDPRTLESVLTDGREIALLDVRERGRFGRAHLLLAVNLPSSQLELVIHDFVPRPATRIVVCDGGEGLAERAARALETAGYRDVAVLTGSVEAWAAAGLELFRGHYVSAYAFGMYVGQGYATPEITAEEVKAKADAGEAVLILDTRSAPEFRGLSIPGAINAPIPELAYRIRDLAPDPHVQIVVNCGGVTRGMLGCQSLIEVGVENAVMTLTNGTRGWDLAGYELAQGATRSAGPTSPEARAWAEQAAETVARRFGVRRITATELDEWRAETEMRTLYLVDVRTRDEYEAGHVAGSTWIPGGELVGCTEDYIATRNARICLIDDNGARAIITASWLTRMGWPDVAVLEGGITGQALEQEQASSPVPALDAPGVPTISAAQLAERIGQHETLVIDFAGSGSYRLAHIPGAWWMLRSGLPRLFSQLPAAERYVATSPDGRLALLAAADMKSLLQAPVMALQGGTDAWCKAGYDLVQGMVRPLGEIDDVFRDFAVLPGDDRTTVIASHHRNIDWQNGLLPKIDRDKTFSFPALPS